MVKYYEWKQHKIFASIRVLREREREGGVYSTECEYLDDFSSSLNNNNNATYKQIKARAPQRQNKREQETRILNKRAPRNRKNEKDREWDESEWAR